MRITHWLLPMVAAALVLSVGPAMAEGAVKAAPKPPDLPYTCDIVTPHIKWAKPLPGGKLRVLFLTDAFNGREAAELAQRLDMEIVWVTAARELGDLGRLNGLYGSRRGGGYLPAHMYQNIRDALGGQLDAIIIGSVFGPDFPEDILTALSKKVSEGTGLVYVAPADGPKKLYDLLPVIKGTGEAGNGLWRSATPHFITGGVPFDSLPRTGYTVHAPKAKAEDGMGGVSLDTLIVDAPAGTVIATITSKIDHTLQKTPLIVTQEGPGKGRVVVFTYNVSSGVRSVTPWLRDRDTSVRYWEYHLALLAKALVWSARREPAVQLIGSEGRVTDGRPEIAATFQNGGNAAELTSELTLRDPCGQVEWQDNKKISIAPGKSTIPLPLPAGTGGGTHMADMIFRDAQSNAVAWGAASVTVKGPVVIDSVTADKRIYRPGDTVKAEVTLRPAGKDGGGDARLTASLTDSLGRLLARSQQSIAVRGETKASAEFKLDEPLVTTARIHFEAELGGRVSAMAEREILMLPRRFVERSWGDDWSMLVWGSGCGSFSQGGHDYLAAAFSQRLKEFGVNATFRQTDEEVRVGFQIMPGVPFHTPEGKMTLEKQMAAYEKTRDKKYLERPISLNDPDSLKVLSEYFRPLVKEVAWLEPIGYNMGDEISVTDHVTPFDYDFAPAALSAFREWLKTQYASLEELNRQWRTDFAAWDAVMPMTTIEVKAREGKGRGDYSPWADHRAFMDVSYANFVKWTREQLRRDDPRATIGMSGTQAAEAYGGYDWSLLGPALDFAQTYTHANTDYMHRSFAPDMQRMPWFGYGMQNPSVRSSLWLLLFQGSQGNAYWQTEAMFNPDLTYGRTVAHMAPVVREFRSGLARLLRSSRRIPVVGVHYSQASIRGVFITGKPRDFSENRAAWVRVTEALGYPCEFLDSARIEAGELLKRNYSAFVLPRSVALSDKEAAELRRYVEAGGLLLADGKTGLMDEHCGTRQAGALDELFGVTRPSADPLIPVRKGSIRFTRNVDGGRLSELTFEGSVTDPDIKIAGSEAMGVAGAAIQAAGQGASGGGEVPVFIVRKLGKGAAVLMNFFFSEQSAPRSANIDVLIVGAALNIEIVRSAMAVKGVRPPVAISAEGTPAPQIVCPTLYASGDSMIVGAILNPGDQGADWSAQVNLAFPREGYIYDLREGKPLGRGRTAGKRVLGGDAVLYAVAPYQVDGVAVTVDQPAQRGGGTVRYNVRALAKDAAPGPGVFVVEVCGPDGQPRQHYASNLTAANGQAAGSFQTALNDPPGAWTIKAVDYVTRVAGQAAFEISK